MNRKGVSPVVSTILLIIIVVILAIIIFLWARRFIGEVLEKEIHDVKQSVEKWCLEVQFKAQISGDYLFIVNEGDVPIYGINVKLKGGGSATVEEVDITEGGKEGLEAGATSDKIDLVDVGLDTYASGDEVKIIPVLLGKSGKKRKKHTCADSVGVEPEL